MYLKTRQYRTKSRHVARMNDVLYAFFSGLNLLTFQLDSLPTCLQVQSSYLQRRIKKRERYDVDTEANGVNFLDHSSGIKSCIDSATTIE